MSSGAPYGSVDTSFLIDQATVDQDGTFCFNQKAARAADHLLVARYFDYMQIPFHKTVAALEWSLIRSLEALLKRRTLDLSGPALVQRVKDGGWSSLDDQMVIGQLRTLRDEIQGDASQDVLRDHLASILDRRPAKLLAGWDTILPNKDESVVAKDKYIAGNILNEICNSLSINRERIELWTTPVFFSKFDGSLPFDLSEESAAEAVLLLDKNTKKAVPLVARQDTLLRLLSTYRMAGLRVYYLPENGEPLAEETRRIIIERFSLVLGQPVF